MSYLYTRSVTEPVSRFESYKPVRFLIVCALVAFAFFAPLRHAAANSDALVDSAGYVGWQPSITIGIDGYPVISYENNNPNWDLKFVRCISNDCSSTNAPIALDSPGWIGAQSSIAIGADGFPVVTYLDSDNSDLKLVHCTSLDCATTDAPRTLDSAGLTGYWSSVRIGIDGFPAISYFNDLDGDLKFIHCTSVDCSSADLPRTLDSGGRVGLYNSSIVGADGMPFIVYFDQTNFDLKTVHCTAIDCSAYSPPQFLVDTDFHAPGENISIALGADGNPIVSYQAWTQGLAVIHCTQSDCSMAAPPIILDSTLGAGVYSSIAIGIDGNPAIGYYKNVEGDLAFVHCRDASCDAQHAPLTLESTGTVGAFASLAIGADGYPVIAHYDWDNQDLRVFHCSKINCDTVAPATTLSTSPVTPNGTNGWFTSNPTITLSRNESGSTGYRWDSATSNTAYSSAFAYNGGQGTHTLYYQSTDDALNVESAKSQVFKVDTAVPATPTLSGSATGSSSASLSWTAATDATSGVAGYKLYNANTNALLATTASRSSSRTGLSPSTTYRYYVKSYDNAGNLSAASNTLSITTSASTPATTTTTLPAPDTTPPSTPALSGFQSGTGEISLFWSPATDSSGIAGYKLYASNGDSLIESFSETAYGKVLTSLTPGSYYSYYVKAYDPSNNYSAASNRIGMTLSSSSGGEETTDAGAAIEPVTVNPNPSVSLTFNDVTVGGQTTAAASPTPPGEGAPGGFQVGGTFFEISTTATFTGPITVALRYEESEFEGDESNLRLLHYEGGQWTDVTVSVDTENNIIYGETTSLSPFFVGQPELVSTGGPLWALVAALSLMMIGGAWLLTRGEKDASPGKPSS